MSVQLATSHVKGIIGFIGKMNGSGTQVVVYVNELDKYGQRIGRQKFHIALFNDAERALIKNNAKKGDTIFIDNAIITSPPTIKSTEEIVEPYSAFLKCTWYNQITIVASESHKILMSRGNHLSA